MKATKLSELPIAPEKHETAHYDKVDYANVFSQMSPVERKFINGLLRYYQPERVLEIGVSRGGGTVNILNAISDMPNTTLCSIDVNTSDWCGIEAMTAFPHFQENKWRLIKGKDPSEAASYLEECGGFDFAIIDSLHLHPVECLNFLSVLPYLNNGAIVVLHDISVFAFPKENGTNLAPRILISSVVADKLSPEYGDEIDKSSMPGIVNIVAFQISLDTRKYIDNVFCALLHPWEYFPRQYLDSARRLIAEHYSVANLVKFDKAREQNGTWQFSGKQTFSGDKLRAIWVDKFATPTVFYGAGYHMRNFLYWFCELGIPFSADVWDINAFNIGDIYGYSVSEPDFETVVQGRNAIITIEDNAIAIEVRAKLEPLGYTVYHGISEYMLYGE